ncbi:MAG: ATP-binding protein [Bradymonadia bacterium]
MPTLETPAPSRSPAFAPWRADAHRLAQALLKRYLSRYWYRAAQGAGSLSDLFVTIEEVSAELEVGKAKPPIALPDAEALDGQIVDLRTRLSQRLEAHEDLPPARLGRFAQLDATALELVTLLATLEGSPGLLRVCTFAWADFAVKQPTAGFLLELLADDEAHRADLEDALAPDAALRRLRLVQLGEDRRWQPATPLLLRPIFVPDAVRRCLSGRPILDESYTPGAVSLEMSGPGPKELVIPDPVRFGRLLGPLAQGRDTAPVLLVGAPGSGRRTLARAYALMAKRPLFCINTAALPWEVEPFETQLAAALRDGFLLGALILIRAEPLGDRNDRRGGALARLLRAFDVPVVLTADRLSVAHIAALVPHARSLSMDEPPTPVRTRLYAQLLEKHAFEVPPGQVMGLADMYKLRPGDLDRALRDVRVELGDTATLDTVRFDQAIRRQIRTHLADLATFTSTTQTWDDLIIEEEVHGSLMEILAHARFRTRVFEEWGFARKLGSKGRGLSCLFSGPPGTGKTMSAALIAKELGLDMYQVDLSRIVDKYVGETEKNLARLFDEASRVPVVLLFDEADSLFAKRTKVESSNDRYANLEVNFLLQRMEAYEGISILTTNLGTGIDQAFKRRLRFRLHFDLPKEEERLKLWRSMVPPGLALDPDLDWIGLARQWEMSGALIRNSMVRAAFLAAAQNTPLTTALLHQAARSELIEMGRLGSGTSKGAALV